MVFFYSSFGKINIGDFMKIGIDIDDTLTNTKDEQIKYWKIYTEKKPHPKYTSELPDYINEFSDGIDFYNSFFYVINFSLTGSTVIYILKYI